MLCIGVFRGESIAVWSDWFWRGRVVGLDVNLAPAAAYYVITCGAGAPSRMAMCSSSRRTQPRVPRSPRLCPPIPTCSMPAWMS